MKKIILLIICTVCLTGCTLNYEIDFGFRKAEIIKDSKSGR